MTTETTLGTDILERLAFIAGQLDAGHYEEDADSVREAAAEIESLRLRAVPEGWQPIESAPKDGTPVALFIHRRSDPFQCGYWLPAVDDDVFGHSEGTWWIADGRCRYAPTLWMPLPPPPTGGG